MTSKTCYEKWVDGVTGESLVRDAARLSLRHRLKAVLQFLNLAANHSRENVEYVHLLRVWTRRSTAALRLYTRILPKKELRSIRRKLERIRRAAGDARDLDVFLGQMVDAETCQSSSFANRVRRQREKAQRPIKKCFERAHRRRRLQKLLDKILEKILNNVESSRLVRDWAHVALGGAVERFHCAFPSDSNDLQSLHRFRARVKDLRYAIELLVTAYPIELKSSSKLRRLTGHR